MMLRFLVQLSILSLMINYAKGAKWDHWSADHGPAKWSKYWPHCNGTKQSPINIDTLKAKYDQNLGNITFNNYGEPTNVTFTATNNGHSFAISFSSFTSGNEPTIEGGGLPGTFKLLGFHFHWGRDNDDGAEHHLDNNSHPCELHMVHMNTKYSSVAEAKNNTDGLAVLGVFVGVIGKKNDVFDNFLNMSKYNVIYPNMTATVTPFSLMALLPSNKSFYRYNGSLTTPGCDEVVTWTLFANDMGCSADQLDEFRKMMYRKGNENHPMQPTDRPVQPLNGREVKANFEVLGGRTPDATITHKPNATVTHKPYATASPTREATKITTTTCDSNGISGNLVLITSLFLAFVCFLKM